MHPRIDKPTRRQMALQTSSFTFPFRIPFPRHLPPFTHTHWHVETELDEIQNCTPGSGNICPTSHLECVLSGLFPSEAFNWLTNHVWPNTQNFSCDVATAAVSSGISRRGWRTFSSDVQGAKLIDRLWEIWKFNYKSIDPLSAPFSNYGSINSRL